MIKTRHTMIPETVEEAIAYYGRDNLPAALVIKQVWSMTGLEPDTILARVEAGTFPVPSSIDTRGVRYWRRWEVDAFVWANPRPLRWAEPVSRPRRPSGPLCPACGGCGTLSVDGRAFGCDVCEGAGRLVPSRGSGRRHRLAGGAFDRQAEDLSTWTPTAHGPGSADKVAVLEARFARKQPLFHPLDRREMDPTAQPCSSLTKRIVEGSRWERPVHDPSPIFWPDGAVYASRRWISRLLHVPRKSLNAWRDRAPFPQPVYRDDKPYLFNVALVLDWCRQVGINTRGASSLFPTSPEGESHVR